MDAQLPQSITKKKKKEKNHTNKLITKIFSEMLKVALLASIILMSMYVENYTLVANIERLILLENHRDTEEAI